MYFDEKIKKNTAPFRGGIRVITHLVTCGAKEARQYRQPIGRILQDMLYS